MMVIVMAIAKEIAIAIAIAIAIEIAMAMAMAIIMAVVMVVVTVQPRWRWLKTAQSPAATSLPPECGCCLNAQGRSAAPGA